ncbi:MAG: glycosyltransferase family 4 protein [Candidatus Eremiobacteraeota bacterium]|nr:glycosyltransferase family 4 protein [Candidatus Eremiobacteraeota bacterium]
MRIVLVHNSMANIGGAEKVGQWLCSGLSQKGHEVTLLAHAFNKKIEDSLISQGVCCKRITLRPVSLMNLKRRLAQFKFTFDNGIPGLKILPWHIFDILEDDVLDEIGRSIRPILTSHDVIISNIWPVHLWIYRALKKQEKRPPILLICHEPNRELYSHITDTHTTKGNLPVLDDHQKQLKKWDQIAFSMMDKIIANSNFTAGNTRAIYPNKDIKVAYMGFHEERARYNPSPGSSEILKILTVNRLFYHKNVQGVIKAYSGFKKINPDLFAKTVLQVVGTGPYEENLKLLSRELGVNDKVEFTGFVGDEILPEYYVQADLVIYLPYDEPFGLVPVEAMFWEKPVIASSHGGPSETVVDGETGYLVDPGDHTGIAKAIEKLLLNPDLRTRMGVAGKSRVENMFTFDQCIDQIEQIIREKASLL